MREKVVLLSMGTRPEIIKMAPVYHALKDLPLRPLVLHTGQHEDLAWPLYDFFRIKPAFELDLKRERPSLGNLSALLIDRIDEVLGACDVQAVLVHGDTSSALMAALAAFYHKLPVGHVEAGLRSFDDHNPFPEEKNRQLIARVARWHFAPTRQAMTNLAFEGIAPHAIHTVGNTIVDATRWGMRHVLTYFSRMPTNEACRLTNLVQRAETGRLLLVTAHRRENWGAPITEIARAVRRLAETHDDLFVVWPVHPNPEVRRTVEAAMTGLAPAAADRLLLTEPLNYPQMLWLLHHAWLVLTDSGGIQEEAATVNTPVLVLREKTERPELIEAGGGLLIGANGDAIRTWVTRLMRDADRYRAMTAIENPYGDGRAAEYIAGILYHELFAAEPTSLTYAA